MMNTKQNLKIAIIIPAYNEETRVGKVVQVALDSGVANRVYVVDDGSTDNTAKEAAQAGAFVLRKERNEGKGAAIQYGIKNVEADVYLLLDADLYGLQPHHLKVLLEPLINDPQTGMVLGRLTKGRLATNLSHWFTPNITGQRAIRRDLAVKLPDLTSFGFAVELFLNDYCLQNGYKLVYVDLEGVSQFLKEEKIGVLKGFYFRLKMYRDMLNYLYLKTVGKVNFQ
jgi:glycosyltransferase involved in cell wall biosynthesis